RDLARMAALLRAEGDRAGAAALRLAKVSFLCHRGDLDGAVDRFRRAEAEWPLRLDPVQIERARTYLREHKSRDLPRRRGLGAARAVRTAARGARRRAGRLAHALRPASRLEELRFCWNRFGETDPLWAVLSHRDKRGNRWDAEEFFRTGRREIDEVMRDLRALELDGPRRRALDFGCGVGRLTQALARHFEEVDGVDVSPSMIRLAHAHDRQGGRCRYHLNERDDLRRFPDGRFDLVYSNITLQHMPPALSKRYLGELLRVAGPGGVLVFQLAERHRFLARPRSAAAKALGALRWAGWLVLRRLYRWWRLRILRQPLMDIYGVRREEVARLVRDGGATLVDVSENDHAGPDWTSLRYCVVRAQGAGRSGRRSDEGGRRYSRAPSTRGNDR
ncbi:MAG: methyltransferase domain-containing protein, partial [Planctomycetota bacterium]